ncbi:unnamed protein product, partial [Ectocarpus fasciculatus]
GSGHDAATGRCWGSGSGACRRWQHSECLRPGPFKGRASIEGTENAGGPTAADGGGRPEREIWRGPRTHRRSGRFEGGCRLGDAHRGDFSAAAHKYGRGRV